MRVTHVITRLILGGAQENTIASVLGLQQKPGLQVDLISGPSTGPEGSLEHVFAATPQTLTLVPNLVRPVHPVKDFLALRQLEKIFQETRPQIVHTHSGKAGILGRLAAARVGVPIIIHHIHGPSFGPFQGPLANAIFTAAERRAGRVTTHFFCTAQAMTRLYLAAGIGRPEMFTRVFSGFRIEPFLTARNDLELRARLKFAPEDFVIGNIGRLAPLKGHSDLLAALRDILPQVPHAKLLFVGDGALRKQIENETRALGLADKVTFTGLVPPDEVARHIGIMDCVAHLSSREALSRALPQALAASKPVIAYDFDGAAEVCLDGETGFLIRTGDIAAAARRIVELARDPALRERLGRRGQELVKTEFRVEHMVDQQYQVYLELAKRHGIPIA